MGTPVLVTGDLFQIMLDGYDAVGVTTNGECNSWGVAVMGAGIARAAKQRWSPWLAEHLGAKLVRYGNNVHVFENEVDVEPKPRFIFSFPTKHSYADKVSDIVLIHRSCEQLMAAIRERKWAKVAMPQPGTGLGRLGWSDVWKVISPILDERVHIVTLPSSGT